MKFSVSNQNVDQVDAGCLVLFIHQKEQRAALSSVGNVVDVACNGKLSALIKQDLLSAKREHIDVLFEVGDLKCEQIMLVGLGDASTLDSQRIRKLFTKLVTTLDSRNIKRFTLSLDDLAQTAGENDLDTQANFAQLLVESAYVAQYQYTETMGEEKKKITQEKPLEAINFLIENKTDEGGIARSIAIGRAIGEGTSLSKNLANLPGNICTPSYLAKVALQLGKEYGISTTVIGEARMKKLGMGALLSVSKGSREPAKLITMQYNGDSQKTQPIVIVGKGLTFDAGGISIKPAAAMDEMKYDMCGGATVLGVMRALGELKLPINVVGVVASSENMPDGAANKPGDVVTSMKGLTIEILNTDAEGRLLLCDALTYVERYQPSAVIDIATLTGACMVALGQHASGLFSNDDELAKALTDAGEASGDRVWRLPIWDEYQQQLKSNFADLANIGGRYAGAVTAACFLENFAQTYKWAHLDIAGTAWKSGASKGSTGRPVGLMMQYLLDSLKP